MHKLIPTIIFLLLFLSQLFMNCVNKTDINEMAQKQPKVADINHTYIEDRLQNEKITQEICQFTTGTEKNIYLVKLNDGLLAVFKKREDYGQRCEIMTYEIASKLLKFQHAITPTVKRTYKGMNGVLQLYIHPDTELNQENLLHVINNISKESYADLQVLKYIIGLQDTNLGGLMAWKNDEEKFCLTSIDNESYSLSSMLGYGQTYLGKSDITEYFSPRDAFNSSYTSFFNLATINHLKIITSSPHDSKQEIVSLYQKKGYNIEDELCDGIIKRCENVIKASN